MRSRSYLFLLLVVGLSVLSVVLLRIRPTNWGLDIQGGVRLIYQIDPADIGNRKPADLAPKILQVLGKRVSSALGVVEGSVAQKGDDQFVIELPGYTDEASAEAMLGRAASIKFYWAKTVTTPKDNYRPYSDYEPPAEDTANNPQMWFIRTGSTTPIQPTIPDPSNPAQTIPNPEYIAIINSWGDPILQGDDLANAQPQQGQGQSTIPEMSFSPAGSAKLEAWSRSVFNKEEKLAAVLDNVVLSDPYVDQGEILKESIIIRGTFKPAYVASLCDILNSGSLPVKLKPLSSQTLEPTEGRNALAQMYIAGEIAFGVICLFMLLYYGFPGVVAIIALSLYMLFTITTLRLIGATFSLAAIAGFVLSVGMAVDANILVFERFKEEIKSGKGLQEALELGFKRALPAIIDSNACTVLTSLVLLYLGSGPVKGFATTLIIGVLISLFTAVTVTRSLLMFSIGSGLVANPKWYALTHNWFKNVEERASHNPVQVVQNSTKWFALSILTIVVFVPFAFMGGFKFDVEFRGGYETTLSLASHPEMTRTQIEQALAKSGMKEPNVKMGSTVDPNTKAKYPLAIVSVLSGTTPGATAKDVANEIAVGAGLTPAEVQGFSMVGATIRQETYTNAILAIIISSCLIVVYLAFRFGLAISDFYVGLRFGFSAIIALIHDILVVIGITAFAGYMFHWEISSLFITSMLTIIGFSVHDTIVIFDRIRENLRRPQPGETFDHLVNKSITQSFARSINTSMTVIVTLFILLMVGSVTPDLKLFCVTMLAGIISGTYSSIFNASPILYLWDKAIGKSKGEDHTLLGAARKEAANARLISPIIPDSGPAAETVGGRSYGQVRRRASSKPKNYEVEEP